jgi:hypothetical protein
MIRKGLRRDARKRSKELESFMSANKDGDLVGYDLAVARVTIELKEFYSIGLHKVKAEEDVLAYAKYAGFSDKDHKWIS